MISLLISLLILCLVLAVFWWILSMIPIPPQFRWIINVLIAVIFLIALLEMVSGAWHPALYH